MRLQLLKGLRVVVGKYQNTVRESTYQRVLTLFDTAILEHFKDVPVKKITIPYCQKVINKWNKKYKDMKAVRSMRLMCLIML